MSLQAMPRRRTLRILAGASALGGLAARAPVPGTSRP